MEVVADVASQELKGSGSHHLIPLLGNPLDDAADHHSLARGLESVLEGC